MLITQPRLEGPHGTGLRALRERIAAAGVPTSPRHTRVLATWNVRELGRRPRRSASLLYIAEVIRAFDLVSIVELRDDLSELREILRILGPAWAALYSAPVFDQGGNRERSAFVFDTRRVRHTGLASGAQAPRTKRGAEYLAKIDWWRAPYIASFHAGDRELLIVTAHIRWGASPASRIPELALFADWVAVEMAKDPLARGREIIAMGDFNVPRIDSPQYEALTRRGLTMPAALAGVHGTNLAKNKRYDQLLCTWGTASGTGSSGGGGKGSGETARGFTGKGGTVDFYTGGIRALYPGGVDKRQFTYEMSDHLPLWAELAVEVPNGGVVP